VYHRQVEENKALLRNQFLNCIECDHRGYFFIFLGFSTEKVIRVILMLKGIMPFHSPGAEFVRSSSLTATGDRITKKVTTLFPPQRRICKTIHGNSLGKRIGEESPV